MCLYACSCAFRLSVCLLVCLSVCLSACLSVCLSACLSVCLSVCVPVRSAWVTLLVCKLVRACLRGDRMGGFDACPTLHWCLRGIS